MKHIETDGQLPMTTFRKIALGNWRHSRDPQTYAEVELDMEPCERFLEEIRKDHSLSLTHYIAKILGDCMARHPDLNSVILRGKLYRRKNISAFISTLLKHEKGADLSGFSIPDIDQLSIHDIAEICDKEIARLRHGDDPEFHALDRTLGRIPMWLVTPLFRFMDFVKYTLNLATRSPGMQQDRFGSVIITNIGALGLQSAFTPLTPVARTPLLLHRSSAGTTDFPKRALISSTAPPKPNRWRISPPTNGLRSTIRKGSAAANPPICCKHELYRSARSRLRPINSMR